MKILNTLLFVFLLLTIYEGRTQATDARHNNDFDFWVGEWNVYKYGSDTLVGESKIEKMLGDLVVKESYQSTRGGYMGTSLNKYNSFEKRWEQYWVDNGGTTLHITGGLNEGSMILQNKESRSTGMVYNRITWEPEERGSVRQSWDQKFSEDGEWVRIFDGRYEPVNQ